MPQNTSDSIPGFRAVPRTGVIYVMHRAAEAGYCGGDEDWCNLGQGSPETGVLPGAPQRRYTIEIHPVQQSYGPVGGITELRAKVADLYNRLFRRGLPSQYSVENVAIAPGGRAAMARVVAALGPMNLGHFIPDYTAYEELLFTFRGFIPIPILLDAQQGYVISAQELEKEVVGRGLSAVLLSNPSNPTGQVISGARLADWVELARRARCSFLFDEFYSHYLYDVQTSVDPPCLSAAEFVEDVDRDPVVLINGLTKNWRYPGWRISWIVGPREVIEAATSAGSFLDGGANHSVQASSIEMLEPSWALQEARALQKIFAEKRNFLLPRLRSLGILVDAEPRGAFYVWGNLANLPEPLADGGRFFEEALKRRVITVPGAFFDVNPGRRRRLARFQTYSRFSFGPPLSELERGIDRIAELVSVHR